MGKCGEVREVEVGEKIFARTLSDSRRTRHTLRRFEDATEGVRTLYRVQRSHQTLDYVLSMKQRWLTTQHEAIPMHEAIELLNAFVDVSDPDVTLPNVVHAFQTAERARVAGEPYWFVLCCLIHDVGKVMFRWGDDETGTTLQTQWGIVGDTFVVGAPLPDILCFPEFNPPHQYSSINGIYDEKCGLESLHLSFGHDEYLYQVLKRHPHCTIPEHGLLAIRYHSCYALHSTSAYDHFLHDMDFETVRCAKRLSGYDLYSKNAPKPDIDDLWPFYKTLLEQYCGGEVCF